MNLAVVGLDVCYAHALAHLFEEKGVKIAYVVDSNAKRVADYSKKWGAQIVPSIAELPWDKIDGGLITTITTEHAPSALQFTQHGIPFYVHDQLAGNYPEARKIVETARQKNVAMLSGSLRRFSPAFRTVADHLKRGDLGDPVIVHSFEPHGMEAGNWQDQIEISGGFIVNMGVHCIEPICSLLGDDIASVHCIGGKYIYPKSLSEAACVITAQFKSGAMAIAEVLGAQSPFLATQPSLRVTGTKATLEGFVDEGLARAYRGRPVYDPATYDYLSGYRDMTAAIVTMMKTKQQQVPYDNLLAVSRILAMARLSYEEGRTVYAKDFPA